MREASRTQSSGEAWLLPPPQASCQSLSTYIINLEIARNPTMVLGVENTGTGSKPISGVSSRELGVTKM